MKVEVKKEKDSQIKLIVSIEPDDLKKYESIALKKMGEKIAIKGFRKGHIPVDVLKEHVGADVLKAETVDVALPQTYAEAILKEKIEVISRPEITFKEPKEGDTTITYEAIVAVMPEVKLGDYGKIKIKEEKIEVKESEIDDIFKQIESENTKYVDANDEAKAKKGDKIEMDFDGFDEGGAVLEGTSSKNHPIILGSDSFVPGFEENVIGLKKGEKKEFVVTFPKDYFKKSFQNKKVTFKVEIKNIQHPEIPEINEEFLLKITGKKQPIADFREEVREGIDHKKKSDEKNRREGEFLEGIIKVIEMEMPPQIVEEEIDFMLEDIKMDIERKGMKFEDYMKRIDKDEKKMREELKVEAEKRLKLRFGLREVYKAEKFEIKDEDVDKEVEGLAAYAPKDKQDEIRKMYKDPENDMNKRLRNKLMLDMLFKKYL